MICSPNRQSMTLDPERSEEEMKRHAKQIIEMAARYLPGLRQRSSGPDPLTEIVIERMQTRFDQIHSVGRDYLPEGHSSAFTPLDSGLVAEPVRVRRNDRGAIV